MAIELAFPIVPRRSLPTQRAKRDFCRQTRRGHKEKPRRGGVLLRRPLCNERVPSFRYSSALCHRPEPAWGLFRGQCSRASQEEDYPVIKVPGLRLIEPFAQKLANLGNRLLIYGRGIED